MYQVLTQELKHQPYLTQRLETKSKTQKFQVKKKKGHRNIFPPRYTICVNFHSSLSTHVGINFPYSPNKWIQQPFCYSGIISYSNKTNKQGLILAAESFRPIKIWQIGGKHFFKTFDRFTQRYIATSGKNIKKWQLNQENITWILICTKNKDKIFRWYLKCLFCLLFYLLVSLKLILSRWSINTYKTKITQNKILKIFGWQILFLQVPLFSFKNCH